MKLLKKLTVVPVSLAMALAIMTASTNPAAAAGSAQTIPVRGTFHTIALTCPPPDENEQCVIDQLGGGLIGTNKLITQNYTENSQYIAYHDSTYITTQYGLFTGDEYGVINKQTGAFQSVATLTSNDGCGSTLTNYNNGQIDLETLEDSGTYQGVLVKKSCN
jgi:hypothetical protein